MEIWNRIFVFILLVGMTFTVVVYLPLTEEIPHKKIELAKKTNSTDGSGINDETGDDEPEDHLKDFMISDIFAFRIHSRINKYHGALPIFYFAEPADKCLPPPRA